MAKVCYFTGHEAVSGDNHSHVMSRTKHAVKPNLQEVTIPVNGRPKKAWASTHAFRSGRVKRV